MTDVPVSLSEVRKQKTCVYVTLMEVDCRSEETAWNLLLPSAILA